MKRLFRSGTAVLTLLTFLALFCLNAAGSTLEAGFAEPPNRARLRAYWWWLNGNVTRGAITRDLEEMKSKGFGGALICDAGGAEQDGNDRVPHGPTFFTREWRELYQHALREGDRLGLEMSLNIQSGWNLGGPMVSADDAAKKLVWSEVTVTGPARMVQALPKGKTRDNYYRDLYVVAYPLERRLATNRPVAGGVESKPSSSLTIPAPARRPIQNWEQKAMYRALHFSAPDTTPLFQEVPAVLGEEDTRTADVLDVTDKLTEGVLEWNVPAGSWVVLRFGSTIGDHSRVSTSSEGWQGYALDVLDAGAFQRYWDAVVEPLIADAGPLAGKALKYLHTDSWEVEAINWTPTLREEFRKRRGYDWLPFLPVLAGRIVNSREESNRFLHDFRKTLGDLAVDNHFAPFRRNAHRHGLEIHPESGGPHAVPIDAQRTLGWNDVPMSEFWAWSWRHRVGESNRFFIKQPASAAHVNGRPLVAAEGFTTIGPHWQETIWDNLKPSFDRAACEGMNLLFWHAFVCSPDEMGVPGQQYFAGTHFNPQSTWWAKSAPFLNYINRCQFMLQEGLFVADVAYYYGDHVPNFAQLKRSDPARVLPGYDYDVITEEAILTRLDVRDNRVVLPDGMSYRLIVLPNRPMISLPVLRKLKQLATGGATIIGPRATHASTRQGFPGCDAEVRELADALWGPVTEPAAGSRAVGKGRVISGQTARAVLLADGVKPDFEQSSSPGGAALEYIHRRVDETEIYFISNPSNRIEQVQCTFRVAGKAPELWDPVTGDRHFAAAYSEKEGRTIVPLEFAPCGSWFVVFREGTAQHPPTGTSNSRTFEEVQVLSGPWTVRFDPKWGGVEPVPFEELVSWTDRPEPGIKFYSGTATYVKTFAWAEATSTRLYLDLGDVRELAGVRLNGRDLGIVWAPPFRVEVSAALKSGANDLEVEVVNFWPNRIIGDAFMPQGKRFTRTNIRKLTKDTALMRSGLFGPVRLVR